MEEHSKDSVLALLEGTPEDGVVVRAAGAAAHLDQPIVLLRVLPLVTRSLRRRNVLSGPPIEPWEQMEAMERNAKRELASYRAELSPSHPVENLVRFGKPVEETLAATKTVGGVRLVTAGGRRHVKLAKAISRRLQIPVLMATEEPAAKAKPFVPDRSETLKSVPALAGMRRSVYRKLAGHLDEVSVDAGTTLLREGKRNQTLWIIVDGQAELSIRGTRVHRYGPGSVVGATSMLEGAAATGTVVSLTSVKALVAGPEDFRSIEGDAEVELRLKAASREVLLSEVRALASA